MAVNIDTQRESVMPVLEALTGSKCAASLFLDKLKEMQSGHDGANDGEKGSNAAVGEDGECEKK